MVPEIRDSGALTLAVGIVGATVMPHAIYLHSALMPGRTPTRTRAEQAKVIRHSNIEVLIALSFAGLVNLAMVAMAASMFHLGHPEVAEIETAYHTLLPLMGGFAALVFMTSLLASGVSSSVVGTMAGQTIMADFVGFRTPLWLRRLLTMAPAFVVVAIGVDPDAGAGGQPGGAEPRAAGADDRAGDFGVPARPDGGILARPDDARRGGDRDGGCARPQHGVVGTTGRGMNQSGTRSQTGTDQQGPIARDGRANTQDDAGRTGSGDPLR